MHFQRSCSHGYPTAAISAELVGKWRRWLLHPHPAQAAQGLGPPLCRRRRSAFVRCVAFHAHLSAAHPGLTPPQSPATEPLLVKPMPSLGHITLTKLESATTKKLDPQCAVARPCSGQHMPAVLGGAVIRRCSHGRCTSHG